jgi:hypothetical protein
MVQLNDLKLDSKFIANAVIKLMKQDILQRFKDTKVLTEEDAEFCEQIDWHPVDEFPINEEYAKELLKN